MKKSITKRFVAPMLSALLATSWAAELARSDEVVPIKAFPQELSDLCWAACLQIVIVHLSNTAVPQCKVVKLGLVGVGGGASYCTGNRVLPTANFASNIAIALANADINATIDPDGRTWNEIQNEIRNRKLVIGNWKWRAGGMHCVVVCGTRVTSGNKCVLVFDPLPENVGSYGWVTHNFYAGNMGEAKLRLLNRPDSVVRFPHRTSDYYMLTPTRQFKNVLTSIKTSAQ